MSVAGIAGPGETIAHMAVVDGGAAAIFVMVGDQDALRFELLDPGGSRLSRRRQRIRPSTYISYQDVGSLSYAGYLVQAPRRATGRSKHRQPMTAPAEGAPYIVTTLTPRTGAAERRSCVTRSGTQYSARRARDHHGVFCGR